MRRPAYKETRGEMVDRLLPLALEAEYLLEDDDSGSLESRERVGQGRDILRKMQAIMRPPVPDPGKIERTGPLANKQDREEIKHWIDNRVAAAASPIIEEVRRLREDFGPRK